MTSHRVGLYPSLNKAVAVTFSLLLFVFSLSSTRAQEKATVSDRTLSLKIPGIWKANDSQNLSFAKDGSIHGSVPLSDGGRQMRLRVTGSWKVLGGKLFLSEELSAGQKMDLVLEIIALTETRMILRDENGGEIRSMIRGNDR